MKSKALLPVALLMGLGLLVGCGAKAATPTPVPVQKPAATQAPAPKTITLKCEAAWPASLTLYDNFTEFIDRVEKMSGGRLKIEANPAGAIVPAFEIQEAVSDGTLDCGHTALGYIVGKHRAAIPLSHGPVYGMDPIDFYGWYYHGGGWELLQEFYQKILHYNVVSFPVGPPGPQALGWFNKEIHSLKDIKGLKYRIYGIGNEVYGRIGVSVVTLPGGEILPALERGTIDAAEWVGGIEDLRLGFPDVLKIHYTPGMHEPVTIMDLPINKDVWDSLSPDLQAIIKTAADATYLDWWTEWQKENAEAYQEMLKKGVKVYRTPDDILLEFLRVYDQIVKEDSKDPFYKKVIDSQKAYAKLVVPYRVSTWPSYEFRAKYYWEDEFYFQK